MQPWSSVPFVIPVLLKYFENKNFNTFLSSNQKYLIRLLQSNWQQREYIRSHHQCKTKIMKWLKWRSKNNKIKVPFLPFTGIEIFFPVLFSSRKINLILLKWYPHSRQRNIFWNKMFNKLYVYANII